MQVTGKLIEKLDSGIVKRKTGEEVLKKDGSPLVKTAFVLQKQGKFPKKVQLDSFNPKVIQFIEDTSIGTVLMCDVDLDSREYNGNWYTNVNAYNVEKDNSEDLVVGKNDLDNYGAKQGEAVTASDDADDLPF